MYAYAFICFRLYVFMYICGFYISMYIFRHCLQTSMYEYSCVDYVVFHLHKEKKCWGEKLLKALGNTCKTSFADKMKTSQFVNFLTK